MNSYLFRDRATILRNIAFVFGSTLSGTIISVLIGLGLTFIVGLSATVSILVAFVLTLPWLLYSAYRFHQSEIRRIQAKQP